MAAPESPSGWRWRVSGGGEGIASLGGNLNKFSLYSSISELELDFSLQTCYNAM
jgi:hypothetical protein